ncbi:Translation factor pelota [Polyrhizophydium stewartii]|uniref:Protein DOM34 homolog n=1 Tax=Polyrhizophydium stewartii TaxID=2732419 RepID=A0ABR4NIB7_9FUNG
MKLVSKHIEKDRSGSVTLVPEEGEDMWHTYNLLCAGDGLKASTVRRIVSESATGSTDKSSVRINLTVTVEDVDFDTQAAVLRVNGRNSVENKFVKLGAYHTIDLELNRPFTLYKTEWDVISLDRITDACDVAKRADIAAVVMEEGFANVCLVTENMTIVRQRIETNIPRKRRGTTTDHDKGLDRFYDQILQAIVRHVDFQVVKVLILASPGFVKDNLYKFIMEHAVKTDNKVLMENKQKMVLVHCSSGHKHALAEVLQEPAIQARLSDTKYAREVRTLEGFYKTLANEPAKAFYGFRHVSKAAERSAIAVMMVTDSLFRSSNVAERRKYLQLVESVRATGSTVLVFSSLHTSGEQLAQLTGIAAILHFPLPDLEEEAEAEEEQERLAAQGVLAPRPEDHDVEEDRTITLGH